jgi:ABC-type transporter Mla MlaB component
MTPSSVHALRLSGDLSLRTISELHATLKAVLAQHKAIAVDTRAVESIDAGTLQLLVSATTTAAAAGRLLSLAAAPDTPMSRALVGAGFFAPDGRLLVPSLTSWTIAREAA